MVTVCLSLGKSNQSSDTCISLTWVSFSYLCYSLMSVIIANRLLPQNATLSKLSLPIATTYKHNHISHFSKLTVTNTVIYMMSAIALIHLLPVVLSFLWKFQHSIKLSSDLKMESHKIKIDLNGAWISLQCFYCFFCIYILSSVFKLLHHTLASHCVPVCCFFPSSHIIIMQCYSCTCNYS